MLVGAQREGGGELVRIGPRPPTPPTPTRSKRRWILLATFGVVVVVALAILARASFDTDDPAVRAQRPARRAAGIGSDDRPPERGLIGAVTESARPAPVPGVPPPAIAAADLPSPPPPSPLLAVGSTPAAGASPSPRAHHSSREARGATGASTSAAKSAGKEDADQAGDEPGDDTKKPDQNMAMAGELAKKDGTWQRPPFGEDAKSRLVAHFTPTGGANLKGRVIDADSGKPSTGVNIEAHVGDAFMRTVTDAAGNFRMTNIYTNRRLTVWLIGRSDIVAERLEVTSPGEGETLDAGVVRLLRGDELASHLEGWMGMFVTRRGRRNVVAAVSPWSPADRAGIQVGDVLLSVEGRDVGGLGPRAASFLLRGPVGSKTTVALQNHDGTVVRYQLERVLR